MKNKIIAFAQLVQSETEARMREQGSHESTITVHAKTTIKEGHRYTKVDVGSSGKYMVEMSTGNIFGIKAYGQIHRGHFFGTVNTISEFYWGDYSPSRKDGTLKTQKANGYPVITRAPETEPLRA
jgi:hypothetical protein